MLTSTSEKIENVSTQKESSLMLIADIFAVLGIAALGYFLIGWYVHFEYLYTGYPDWIYHAFRIRDISQFGIASWDHIWGNGINHWRAFQYVEHYLTLLISKSTGLSITHSMLWLTAVVYISVRVVTYVLLRALGAGRLISFFVVVVSYCTSQEWVAIKDFSLQVGFIVIPLFIYIWIKAVEDRHTSLVYVIAAISGASWSIHPVIGYSFSGLFGLLLVANNIKHELKRFLLAVLVFFISSAPFTIPYFFSGYSFSNPIINSSLYLRVLIVPDGYLGLSLLYFFLIGFSWIIVLIKSRECLRWAKLLLFYCSAYLVFIYFGLLGYYPDFINKFQFTRATPFIALALPFAFGSLLHSAIPNIRSRMLSTIFLILISVCVTMAIEISSIYSGQPVSSFQDPVTQYFKDKEVPKGSIYFKDFALPSYFGKSGLRFVNSYNQSLLRNPFPVRFTNLMKTDISYTGVTEHQVNLIRDYSLVLGVEYIIIPKLSPLVSGLTEQHDGAESFFELVDEVSTSSDVYSILRNREEINNAYIFDEEKVSSYLHFNELKKPTLEAASYIPWDEEISRFAQVIRDGEMKGIDLEFGWPNRLIVSGEQSDLFKTPGIFINQSHDENWKILRGGDITIEPTNIRFMHLKINSNLGSDNIELVNHWPRWHWPVQSLSLVAIFFAVVAYYVSKLFKYRSEEKISNVNVEKIRIMNE